MSKLNRILWTGLVLGIAACGDDVTVTQPPEAPPPGIRSVTVAPNGVTIAIGGTTQMTAAVVTDAGATGTPTITWGTSNAQVATVSTGGLVTGVAAGSVGITATAVLGTSSAQGVATVTVVGSTTTPPTVSINTVLQGQNSYSCESGGTPGLPVDLSNAACQLDVVLNFERNGNRVDSLVLQVDGKTVAKQNFSASAPVEASPELSIENATLSFNTAKYDATTGATDWKNGSHLIQSKIYYPTVTSGPAASNTIAINFNNSSFLATSIKVLNGKSVASPNDGLLWWTGDLEATALPVLYQAGTQTINSVTFHGGSCVSDYEEDTLQDKTVTTAPFKAVWAKATHLDKGGSNHIEDADCDIGTNSVINNNPGPNGWSNELRFDNQGPMDYPEFVGNPNGRGNGWINGTVGLTGKNTSTTDNDWIQYGDDDYGVGGYTVYLRIGDNTDGTVDGALAATESATPALPSPTLTRTTKCAVVTAKDALGNESDLPDEGDDCFTLADGSVGRDFSPDWSLAFGVDIVPPTIAFSGGLTSNKRINAATVGAEFQVTVADTGAVGNSGMLAGAPVIGTVTARNTTGTTGCYAGTVVSGVCTASATGFTPALPLVATNNVAGQTTLGYYTYTGLAQDAAGNKSPSVTRVVVRDNLASTAGTPSVPLNVKTPFTAGTFLNDDLSLRDYYYTVGYSGIAPSPVRIALAPTVIDAFNAATFTYNNFALNSSIDAYQGLQDGTAGTAAAYGGVVLNALTLFVRDQTQPAYTSANTLVTAAVPAAGIDVSKFTGAYTIASSKAAGMCAGTLTAGCGTDPTSTVITVTATGTTATFNNPFSRVDILGSNGVDLVLLGSIPGSSVGLVDNGTTRVFTWTFTLSASAAYAALGGVSPAVIVRNIHAFGVDAAGSKVALVSAAVAQTINP